MAPELAVMINPTSAYRRLAEHYPLIHPARALLRPVFTALVAGVAIGIAATGRTTAALVISTTLCWSFAIVWQIVAAAAVGRAATGRLTFTQRLDLLFTGHAPWSLWLLIVAAWSRLFAVHTDFYVLLSTIAIPAAWTTCIVYGFCKGALGLRPKTAFCRTVLHQVIIWTFAVIYIAWAIALWPRLLSAV